MAEWSFTVDGPIVPYVRTTQRQKFCDPRYKRYQAFKQYVRSIATRSGVPEELEKVSKYAIYVSVRWKQKARSDLDNILKGVMDSLWSQDRRICHIIADSAEYYGKELMKIVINKTA